MEVRRGIRWCVKLVLYAACWTIGSWGATAQVPPPPEPPVMPGYVPFDGFGFAADYPPEPLDKGILEDAKQFNDEVENYIKRLVAEDSQLDRVAALRVLRGHRSRIVSYLTLLRNAVEVARGSQGVVLKTLQYARDDLRFHEDRLEDAGRFIRAQEQQALQAKNQLPTPVRVHAEDAEPLPGLKSELVSAPQSLPDPPTWNNPAAMLHRARDDYAESERQKPIVAANVAKLESVEAEYAGYVETVNNLIRKMTENLSRVDDHAILFLQAELEQSKYTSAATYVFGILVGGVIFGFFVIASLSTAVRTAIFTSDSGIQFVTLFSLVIAIILFGVLGILEGKELSALLGGLSGYILGRSSSKIPEAGVPAAPRAE